MHRMAAQGTMSPEQVYDLTLAMTDDTAVAEQAQAKATIMLSKMGYKQD